MLRRILAFAAPVTFGLVIACSGGGGSPSGGCTDGEKEPCTCAGGASGSATCAGGSFGACACTTPPVGDAGQDTGAPMNMDSGLPADAAGHLSTSDAGFGMYMGKCNMTSDCPSNDTCFDFPSKGMFCTHTCTANTDCEAPSPKCTPRGVCAVPDGTTDAG